MQESAAPLLPSLSRWRPIVFDDLFRAGNARDGGYVLPRSLLSATGALLSLGVEADWSFEASVLRERPGIRVICVDGTTGPDVIRERGTRDFWKAVRRLRVGKAIRSWRLRRSADEFEAFFSQHEFIRLMVAARSGKGTISLADLIGRARAGCAPGSVLLKMDIEGAEYDALLATPAALLDELCGLLVEFHGLDRHWPRFVEAMDALSGHFVVAHLHGNNFDPYVPGTRVPQTLEATLVHRRLVDAGARPARGPFPVPGLDLPNHRRRPDLALEFDESLD